MRKNFSKICSIPIEVSYGRAGEGMSCMFAMQFVYGGI